MGPGDTRQTVDIAMHDLLVIRLVDATPGAIDAVTSRFGTPDHPRAAEPDITVRFTDEPPPAELRYLGINEAAYDDDGFYVLDPVSGRVQARVPVGELGSPCTFTCFSGVEKCPFLLDAVRVALLRKDHVAVHAAAFEHRGAGVLVLGWAYGGKTESLLAFARHGAGYVGDEWVVLSGDGAAMFGIPSAMTIQEWQFPQLGRFRPPVGLTRGALFATIGLLDRTHDALAKGRLGRGLPMELLARALPRLRKQRAVRVEPRTLFPELAAWRIVSPTTVFLVHSHSGPDTCVANVTGVELAERTSASLTYERLELLTLYAAFRFAFPDERNELLESAPEIEQSLLRDALAEKATYVVSHPYEVDFEELFAEMDPVCQAALWQRSLSSA